MKNLHYLLFNLFFVFSLSTYSQISEGGLPPSFTNHVKTRSSIPHFEAPINFNVDKLMWEDNISKKNHNNLRLAQLIPVNLNIDSIGIWSEVGSHSIWQQSISAKGAKAMILSYKDFYIPDGAKLFIYNEDKSQLLGGYNHNTNPKGGLFATEMITGEYITLEYVASTISDEKPRIVVDDIGYVYDESLLVENRANPNSNSTSSCMININCPEGKLWQKQKRGVVMLTIKLNGGWRYCSGSLINNTAEDAQPLLLTASHCFEDAGVSEQTIFYFNYENESCTNGSKNIPETTKTLVGANILVQTPFQKGGDGVLMSLKTEVPNDWHPYYNGWDIRNIAAKSGVVIHHPNGDLKKITTYITPLSTDTYSADGKVDIGAKNAHWKVVYDGNSITQGGSSGSPIFNESGLIVGSLSGGASFCYNLYGPDLFGKLWYNWEEYALESGESLQKMKTYLDPLNKGLQTLQGLDPNSSTGIEDEKNEEIKELVIFPNPAEYELNINTSSLIKDVRIYDLVGKIVYKKGNYNASTMTIPINNFAKGVYTITIQTELKKITDKFIKK